MSLLLVEGFDYWNDGITDNMYAGGLWSVIVDNVNHVGSDGRHGGDWAATQHTTGHLGKILTGAEKDETIIIGVGFRAQAGLDICSIGTGGSAAAWGTPNITLNTVATSGGDGKVRVYEGWGPSGASSGSVAQTGGSAGTLLAESASIFLGSTTGSDVWVYIEIKVSPAGVVVQVDDVEVINTAGGSGAEMDTIWFWGNLAMDDLYILNGKTPAPNSFVGSGAQVVYAMPGTDGTPLEWTSTDATHAGAVNNINAFGTPITNHSITSDVLNAVDMFDFGTFELATSPDVVLGVQVSTIAAKTDTGPRSLAIVATKDGADWQSADLPLVQGVSVATRPPVGAILPLQPDGTPWSAGGGGAEFQFGVKVR
jgi:hypothetical protein